MDEDQPVTAAWFELDGEFWCQQFNAKGQPIGPPFRNDPLRFAEDGTLLDSDEEED